ncbi:type II secretion system F family protein [Patescibacteria group bacterium]
MAKKKTKKSSKDINFDMNISVGRVTLTQKALFAKHISVMLKSGLAITEALSIARDSAKGKLRSVINDILQSVESGNSLSDSFNRHPKVFSDLFVTATYAGESSGTLVENLENVASELESEKELSSKIKSAMLYPTVVMVAAFVLGMVLSFVVLPKIIPLFEGLKADLPATTRGLIWFSHFIQDHSVSLPIGIIATVVFLLWLLRQRFIKPVTHKILLTTPIIKKVSRASNLARFCRTLGTLLKSGLTIDESLDITKKTLGNYYYRKAIEGLSKNVARGSKLSDSLESNPELFPLLVTRMIKVGEESGKFEETLFYLAHFYEVEVDTSTKTMATAIEPVLLIAIGLTVGFLALSIITPIYEITGNVKR